MQFKTLILLVVAFLATSKLFAQDIITKRDGTEIKAVVQEITDDMVKYKKFDNKTGPTYSELKTKLTMILYVNGTKEYFTIAEPAPPTAPTPTAQKQEFEKVIIVEKSPTRTDNELSMCDQGRADSRAYYHGENSGAGGVTAMAILTSPLIALIPYAIIASTAPSYENLRVQNTKLFQNPDYQRCYTETAKETKSKKVGKGMLIGSGVWLGLVLIFYAI